MNTKPLVRAIACVALCSASAAWAGDTRNVILVIADGVRWQEVFTGADPTLLNDDKLKKKYWDDDPDVRRRKLFPFLWETVATQRTDLRQPEQGQRGAGDEHDVVLVPRIQRDGERSSRSAHRFE